MAGAETRQQPRKAKKTHPASANHNANGTERLKTVVRRLPPNLPEDVFWQSVQAWVTDDTVTWKVYHPGKLRRRTVMNKESVPSRAYIAFKNEEMLATFSREYDGHIFKDKAGNESQAIVEYAPFQKIPTERKKVDARNNTIDKDEDYISFLESLKEMEKAEPPSLEALIAAAQPVAQPTTTPLLDALKAEKSAQKDKEAILRNHQHYKEEAKKKAAAAVAQAQAHAAATIAAQAQKQPIEAGPVSQPASRKAKRAAASQKAAAAQDAQPPVRIHTAPPKQPIPAPCAGGASATQHNITPTPTSMPAPPTAPRAHRERAHKGHKASAGSVSVHAKPADPTAGMAPPTFTEGGSTTAATPSPAPGTSQVRRGRPVIGIGRHFEAALSGAVGGGGSGSNGERKRRGEKEKDKDKEGGAPATVVPAHPSGATSEGKNAGGGAGKRNHHASGGKYKEDGKGGAAGGSTAAVPNILQRSDALAAAGEVSTVHRPQSPRDQVDAPPTRGGRRGRGRGRGGHRGG